MVLRRRGNTRMKVAKVPSFRVCPKGLKLAGAKETNNHMAGCKQTCIHNEDAVGRAFLWSPCLALAKSICDLT